MKRNLMKSFVATALMVSLLAGCSAGAAGSQADSGENGSAGSAQTDTAQKADKIVFWSTKEDCFAEDAAEFTKQTGIEVEATYMGGYDEMVNKVMAGIAAEDLPDIAQLGQRHGISQMYDSGYLLAAEDVMPQEIMDDILPGFWKRFTYKGTKVILPFQNSMPVLYYNKTAFEQADAAVPTTLDEVVATAKIMTDGGNYYGFSTNNDTPWYALALLYNSNVHVVDEQGEANIATEAAEKVFAAYQQMACTDKSLPANQHATAQEDFTNQKVMMLLSSCASYAKIQKLVGDKFEVGVSTFPTVDTMDIPMGGNGLGFFKSTPEKQAAAVEFATFMLDPERVAKNTLNYGYIPVRSAAIETETYQEYLKDPNRQIIHNQLESLGGRGVNPADSLIWESVSQLIDAVEADPNTDIGDQLSKIQENVDKYLKEYAGE